LPDQLERLGQRENLVQQEKLVHREQSEKKVHEDHLVVNKV
jgi:hypothetical protein